MPLLFDCEFQYPAGFALNAAFETDDQVTALFGPSGSGKTTVLHLIAGLLTPRQGLIRIGDRQLTDTSQGVQLPPEQRRVGLLFQDHCLFPHRSVLANIQYGWRRCPGQPIDLDRVIETLELAPLLNRYPRSLSGGEQQRVALARAIACAPQCLLLDEPLTAVESPLRDRITAFVQRVIEEFQIPMLLVTHDRHLVDRLATRILPLREGRIDK